MMASEFRVRTSSPTEERRYSPSSGPPNPPPLPSPLASSKPPSSNPSSGSFPKKAYCPASKFSAARNVRSYKNWKGITFTTNLRAINHEQNTQQQHGKQFQQKQRILLKLIEPKGLTRIILHQSPKIRIRNAAAEAPDPSTHQIGPSSTNNNNRTNRRTDQTRRETHQRSKFSGQKPHLQQRRTRRRRGRRRRARRPASPQE